MNRLLLNATATDADAATAIVIQVDLQAYPTYARVIAPNVPICFDDIAVRPGGS